MSSHNGSFDVTLDDGREATAYYWHEPAEEPTGPSFSCAGTPGWPAQAEIVRVTVDGMSIDLESLDGKEVKRLEREALENEVEMAMEPYFDQ